MILIALTASALAAAAAPTDFQQLTSPAFEAFAREADSMCPWRDLRNVHPADLGELTEDFVASLNARERRRVTAADDGFEGCPPAGESCPAQHSVKAIADSRLLGRFTRFACSAKRPL